MFVSEPRNDQTGPQTQPASSVLDQPQGGSGQYQPSGNDPTPHAREGLNSAGIVDAQLTPPTNRDDEAERQDTPRDDDAPMPDAATVHDIATPRRQVGGRYRKWCISTQPTNASALLDACAFSNSAIQKHDFNSGAVVNQTVSTSVLTVSMEELAMTVS